MGASTVCACHAGSMSSDTQGLDPEVTNTRSWGVGGGPTCPGSRARAKAGNPQPVEMARGLFGCSKKGL